MARSVAYLEAHGASEWQGEGFAGGAVRLNGPWPDGIGSVLDDAAAGVEGAHEVVAGEAGEFLGAGGFLLGAFVVAVLGEECVKGGDLLGFFVSGEAVGLGAGDEGIRALEEDGSAAIEAGADEVAVGGEVGFWIAIGREHFVFLLGGALDSLEGGVEFCGGLAAFEGGLLGVCGVFHGPAGAAAGLGDDSREAGEECGVDVTVGDVF